MLLTPLGHAVQQLIGLINDKVRALSGREKGNKTQLSIEHSQSPEATLPRTAAPRHLGSRGSSCSEGRYAAAARGRGGQSSIRPVPPLASGPEAPASEQQMPRRPEQGATPPPPPQQRGPRAAARLLFSPASPGKQGPSAPRVPVGQGRGARRAPGARPGPARPGPAAASPHLGQDVEVGVGDEAGHLQDLVLLHVQARHLPRRGEGGERHRQRGRRSPAPPTPLRLPSPRPAPPDPPRPSAAPFRRRPWPPPAAGPATAARRSSAGDPGQRGCRPASPPGRKAPPPHYNSRQAPRRRHSPGGRGRRARRPMGDVGAAAASRDGGGVAEE